MNLFCTNPTNLRRPASLQKTDLFAKDRPLCKKTASLQKNPAHLQKKRPFAKDRPIRMVQFCKWNQCAVLLAKGRFGGSSLCAFANSNDIDSILDFQGMRTLEGQFPAQAMMQMCKVRWSDGLLRRKLLKILKNTNYQNTNFPPRWWNKRAR